MDPLTILGIAALVGYAIFHESDEEKAAREKREAELARQIEENQRKEAAIRKVQEEEKRKREGPYDSSIECFRNQYVSYSRIATYCSCPRRFKLLYLDKVRPEKDESHYTKGSVFHIAMEDYLKNYIGQNVTQLIPRIITQKAYKLGYLERNNKRWSEKQRLLLEQRRDKFRACAKFLCETLPRDAVVIDVEKELSYQMKNIKYYGIADLILKYPDGHFEIVDYKTGLFMPTKEQLEIYSIPLLQDQTISRISYRIICVDRECHYLWETDRSGLINAANRIADIVNHIIGDTIFCRDNNSKCTTCGVR